MTMNTHFTLRPSSVSKLNLEIAALSVDATTPTHIHLTTHPRLPHVYPPDHPHRQVLEISAWRGFGHRCNSTTVLHMEFPAQQLLDGVARLSVRALKRLQLSVSFLLKAFVTISTP
jgi:hypothetical protein